MSRRRDVNGGRDMRARTAAWLVLLVLAVTPCFDAARAAVPPGQRGQIQSERTGQHDANNIVTWFYNFGMVGDYPAENWPLSYFHSMEVPKGSGMNYSDGVTPFVLQRYHPQNSPHQPPDNTSWNYVMETGYRERQAFNAQYHMMRFEPRPGFFQTDVTVNRSGPRPGGSPAVSNEEGTWPYAWPDKLTDATDPGWIGSWDGYFGKRPAADQESFMVMDDDIYSTLPMFADSTDPTRRGLGLRVEVRGFQWSNPQAANVIFWHYDIANEGTTDYPDAIFGLYMDSGVGGNLLSCDNVYESDDDNAFFDRSLGLNLVYTWDDYGHGVDLSGICATTGYLGYAYMETPGDPYDRIDNDNDGIMDERRDSGPGRKIVGKDAIRAWLGTHATYDTLQGVYSAYDSTKFVQFYGAIANRPAYRAGIWWTGDENLNWTPTTDDVGVDGLPNTHDTGEGDGMPTAGEPNFDQTDKDESDQIGLTGFRMNRIARGPRNQDPHPPDGITFANLDGIDWPEKLYKYFTDGTFTNRFDVAAALNWNIGFLFASGPFDLQAGKRERFSLALAYGRTLTELRESVHTVQIIYNANYQFAIPPTRPVLQVESGDGYVRLSWDNVAERFVSPITYLQSFEGYRIYRSTDPLYLDPRVILNGRGTQTMGGNGLPIAQFDLVDGREGYSRLAADGVRYWLGEDTGIRHTWTDTNVTNGKQYYYAVCAYDYGFDTGTDSTSFYPSENSIPVTQSLQGGYHLPTNAKAARPEPRVAGWRAAKASAATHARGVNEGSVGVAIVNSNAVPDNHTFVVGFVAASSESVKADSYYMRDSTSHTLYFMDGTDWTASGVGPTGQGLLPLVQVPRYQYIVGIGSTTGWRSGSTTTAPMQVNANFVPTLSPNLRRPLYPYDVTVEFYDTVVDTGTSFYYRAPRPREMSPAKFHVIAHTPAGDVRMKFRFIDANGDGTLDYTRASGGEYIEAFTYTNIAGIDSLQPQPTWRFTVDTLLIGTMNHAPRAGDVFDLKVGVPAGTQDLFTFVTNAMGTDHVAAVVDAAQKPYVVPNPYLDVASFEPARSVASGRGERRIEFRAIPSGSVIRIYTVHGDLVQTLRHDGGIDGMVPWDLRTKDNLDAAPGLYVFHVDAPGIGTSVGKFAIVK